MPNLGTDGDKLKSLAPTVPNVGTDGAKLLEKFGTVRCADGANWKGWHRQCQTLAPTGKSLAPTVPNVFKSLTSSVLNFDTVGAKLFSSRYPFRNHLFHI